MLKKDWKKNLLRVKQIADQNLGRAEKSEVLSEDLQHLEKRVDLIKHACTNTHKKLCLCMQVTSSDEKKKKKYTESAIGSTMLESSSQLGHETLIGAMFKLGGDAATTQAFELVQHEQDLETNVLNPLQHLLENEIPAIQKLRKHLVKLTLDMDAAKTRYHSALKQAQNNNAHQPLKLDNIKDEMDDAQQKMEQCRDLLATEMYSFIAREPEFSRLLLKITQAQAAYHRKSLDLLESLVPQMEENFERNQQMPLFGGNLADHLQRTNREIALVIEACITTLHAIGLEEEGLFRIAGAASKVKKLKAAFDSGMVDMAEYINDIHAVSSVLKHYLRELKEPLLTYDLYNDWMQAVQRPPEQRLQALWVVLDRVPKGHYNNIKYVIKFCARLATNQEINKMSPSNIAIVLGPNFIWPQGDSGPSVLSTSMQSAIVEQLITNHSYFFPGEIDYSCATSSTSAIPPYDVSDSNASHLSHSEPATHETYTPLPAQVNNVQPYPGTSQLQPNHKANHDNNSVSPSPKAPRRNPKKNVAPPPPPGTSNTEPQHAAPSSRAEKTRSSIERPTQQPPAVPGKPSVVIPTHERAGSTGSDRPTASPPIKPEKPSVPTKPSHDRKPSGSGATLDRKSSSGTGPTHDRKPSYGTGTPHDKKPSSATSVGTPPVFPDVPRSPRMKPPDRPPQPTKTTTDPQSRGGSLERGLKPELPPHPSQVALDRQQRAGSGRPPRPPSPHQDRKKSVKSGASVDSKSDGIPPLADPEEDEEPIREETRL